MKKQKNLSDVHIAIPLRPGGGIHPDLVLWLLEQSYHGASISCAQVAPVDVCRNEIVKAFLDMEGKEFLLMVDSDIIPAEDAVYRLRDANKEIIGAVCYAWRDVGLYPLLLYKNTEKTWVPGSRDRINKEMDSSGVIRVDATGTGCLMIKREVFTKIKQPFFQTVPGGMGEDIYFCENARKHGYEIYVHSLVPTDHFVVIGLGGVAKFVSEQIKYALDGDARGAS